MGRGRAKAKQTKVARRLKYSTPNTDFQALERELTQGDSQYESDASHSYEAEEDLPSSRDHHR